MPGIVNCFFLVLNEPTVAQPPQCRFTEQNPAHDLPVKLYAQTRVVPDPKEVGLPIMGILTSADTTQAGRGSVALPSIR